MKKLSQITESVWSDIHKRSNGRSLRKENTYRFNINDLKEVDLGPQVSFLWADFDLEANGEFFFSRDQVDDMIPQIEKTGWRLPQSPVELRKFIKTILKNDNLVTEWHSEAFGIIKNTETGAFVSFPTESKWGQSYWATDDYPKYYTVDYKYQKKDRRSFDMCDYNFEGSTKMVLIRTNNEPREKKLKIRLVKDK